MNWEIYCHLKAISATTATATFVHDGKEIGAVEVDLESHARADFAFLALIKAPTLWKNLPPALHRAMLVYRQESLADVEYHSKTYRFINTSNPINTRWVLTTDKSDLHASREQQLSLAL